jgi:hypothetical protein
MARQQTENLTAVPNSSLAAPVPPPRVVVQTVKVPPEVFVKLKTIGARERRSSQDIILSALTEYLERFPAAS